MASQRTQKEFVEIIKNRFPKIDTSKIIYENKDSKKMKTVIQKFLEK